AEQAADLLDQLGGREGLGFDLDVAGFELGEVKDVVDQDEQGLAGLEDAAGMRLGFADVLRQSKSLGKRDARHARLIHEASQTLLGVVGDVLDFSKLEAGQVELEPCPFSIAQLVEEVRGLLSLQASAKGVSLEIDMDGGLPPFVSGDLPRLRQVLVNLTANAVKFTAQGQVLLRPRYDAAHQTLSVAIVDTGPGISPEALPRLFERFSQANVSINRTHGGTGLGLAICKAIVDVMGGEISAESELGRGSTFRFDVPAPLASAPPKARPAPVDVDCPPLTVLLVDDTAMNRELVRLMLGPLDLHLTEASSGVEAIQLAEARPFDLILMDIRMPGIDGLEAARRIRSGQGANRATRIVALTADVEPENLEACVVAGIDGVLPKPISPAQLLAEVGGVGRQVQAAASSRKSPSCASSARRKVGRKVQRST
ncbi:MAG: ATP-binding protein, partial [Phenylobacterium sp.]